MPVPTDTQLRIPRSLLRDGVYVRLRDAIVDGTLAPGEQLRDAELADWLGVSRTPVREALLRLGQVGLVHARPGRSTSVAPLDPVTVREAREVVAAMHRLAVTAAVGRMDVEHVAAMREANDRFAAAVAEGDATAALAADDDLHGVPVAVAGNHAVAQVLEQYGPVLRRAERIRFSSTEAAESLARHDRLIHLCEAGDAAAAAALTDEIWQSLPADEETP